MQKYDGKTLYGTGLLMTFIGILLVLVGSGSNAVALQYETKTASWTGNIGNLDQEVFTLEKFDDQGGQRTLESIDVALDIELTDGTCRIDNDDDVSTSGAVSYGLSGSVTSEDVPLLDEEYTWDSKTIFSDVEVIATSGTLTVEADNGDGLEIIDNDPAEPDVAEYHVDGTTSQQSGTIYEDYRSNFAGGGTFDISVDLTATPGFSGTGGVQYSVDPVVSDGETTVTYGYRSIPEPATLALMFVIIAISFLRRHIFSLS